MGHSSLPSVPCLLWSMLCKSTKESANSISTLTSYSTMVSNVTNFNEITINFCEVQELMGSAISSVGFFKFNLFLTYVRKNEARSLCVNIYIYIYIIFTIYIATRSMQEVSRALVHTSLSTKLGFQNQLKMI